MGKTVRIKINPEILEWARNKAHFHEEYFAKRIGVSSETYQSWEKGEKHPTIRQLYKLSQALNRSLQLFFMEKIPYEFEALAEMRRLPDSPIGEESPSLVEQIQLAVQKRDVALGLYKDLGEKPPSFSLKVELGQDIDEVATLLRDELNISLEKQKSWKDYYQAMRNWRSTLESNGVLVFQIPGVSLQEMRGFSLFLNPLSIIGFNSKDWRTARIFTIFHELTHLLLGDSFLDSTEKNWFDLEDKFEVEQFCNHVAAATLMPTEDVYLYVRSIGKTNKSDWSKREISLIASLYTVSRSVVVRRLRTLDLISDASYRYLKNQYDSFVPPSPSSSGGDFYANKIAHLGSLIPTLAFQAYYNERVTVSDLSMLLGVRAKNLGKLERRIQGFTFGFGSS